MSVFQQCGVMRILRLAVAVAFLLLLLVDFSRGEEPVQALNQGTEAQSSLQDFSDHLNQPASQSDSMHCRAGHSDMQHGKMTPDIIDNKQGIDMLLNKLVFALNT